VTKTGIRPRHQKAGSGGLGKHRGVAMNRRCTARARHGGLSLSCLSFSTDPPPPSDITDRGYMPKKKTPDDQFDEAIEQTMKDTLKADQERCSLPYDGIVGSLYASWPLCHHTEFENARNWILRRISHADALRFLHDYGEIFEEGYNGRAVIPVAYMKAVGTLHGYFTAMELDEEEGLRMVADDNAVIGLRARRGHKKRKPNPDKAVIKEIGAKYWADHPNAVPKDILSSREFETYNKDKKQYASRTYLSWLQEVDPRSKKPGRKARTP
jgi:hypothetical protein